MRQTKGFDEHHSHRLLGVAIQEYLFLLLEREDINTNIADTQ